MVKWLWNYNLIVQHCLYYNIDVTGLAYNYWMEYSWIRSQKSFHFFFPLLTFEVDSVEPLFKAECP